MKNDRWDIFTSARAPESLWFGHQLAKALLERRQAVRLFTEQLPLLSACLADIDASLWIQSHKGVEVVDSRVARICAPTQSVVQLFEAAIPADYLERFSAQPQPSSRIQVVAHDSEIEPTSPITFLESTDSSSTFLAQMGDLPRGAGYIKHGSNGSLMRRKWATPEVRKCMLTALHLPDSLLAQQKSIYVDVRSQVPLRPWIEAFASCGEELCVFVENDDHQNDVLQGVVHWSTGRPWVQMGRLTLVRLPRLRWFLVDELVWACDLLMTDRADKASRASECGAPLLWAADSEGDPAYFDRYALEGREEAKRVVSDAFVAFQSGRNVAEAWSAYLWHWDHVVGLAGRVAQRIQRAPDMADVLLAGIASAQHETVSRQFSPTLPREFF